MLRNEKKKFILSFLINNSILLVIFQFWYKKKPLKSKNKFSSFICQSFNYLVVQNFVTHNRKNLQEIKQ